MTAAWAAAAMLDVLRAEVAAALDDEHTSRQMALESTAAKLATVAAMFHAAASQARAEARAPSRTAPPAAPGSASSMTWRGGGTSAATRPPAGSGSCTRRATRPPRVLVPPPGRALCPAQARTAGQALTDAITYRLDRAAGGCADCEHGPAGPCPGHMAGTGRALAYRQLAAALARALPDMAGEER